MLSERLDSDQIEKWIASRKSNRLRKSIRGGHVKLRSSSINRELSLLRRAYQLGHERKPPMVEKNPTF
jgi:hypothetical protein